MVVGAVVVVVVSMLTSVAAGATAPTQETADVHLTLVEQNLWILPEGRLEATIHLDQLAPAGSEIAVVIYQRLRSRSLFQASLEGELGSPLATVSRPVGELTRDARGDIVVTAPISASNQTGRTRIRVDGVYPLRIELRTPDGDLIDGFTTHLVRSTPDAPGSRPLAVATVVPLAAAPALAPDGSHAAARRGPRGARDLRRRTRTPSRRALTIVPSAETVTALNATASTEDRQLREQLRIAIGARQVVSGPYVDIDAAAMLHDGLADEVTTQLRSGSDALAAALGAGATRRTHLDRRPASGRTRPRRSPRPRRGPVDPAGGPARADRACRSPSLGPRRSRSKGVTVQSTTFVDDGLVAHFTEPGDEVLAAVHLLTDLSQLYFDSPSIERGTVVRPPAGWEPSAAFLDVFLDGLETSPLLDAGHRRRVLPHGPARRRRGRTSRGALARRGVDGDDDGRLRHRAGAHPATAHRLRHHGRRGRRTARLRSAPAARRKRRGARTRTAGTRTSTPSTRRSISRPRSSALRLASRSRSRRATHRCH